jgi:dTDP-4-amino-4,6-dideoxygalactose transaminase
MSESDPAEIPQCDPRASYLAQREAIDAAVLGVLQNGRYILGPELSAFEAEFAAFCGASHAIGVANGTDALELSLRALGVGPGDGVVTVSHTAVATTVAIRAVGAIPLFVDVDAADGLMDPEQLEALLELGRKGRLAVSHDRIRAIVPVHLYGRCADMTSIGAIATAAGIPVVEDCAQAHGAFHRGRAAGTMGALGSFSFYPTKNLGAFGDGGAVICSDPGLAANVKLLREYGWKDRYVSAVEGGNSRLDELQAAILRVKLTSLAGDNARRTRLADSYREHIRNPLVRLPQLSTHGVDAYHQFVVRADAREDLQQTLLRQHIRSLVHYPVPVHEQPAYRSPDYAPLPLVHTENLARSVLSLPMFPQLAPELVRRVANAINAWEPGTAT